MSSKLLTFFKWKKYVFKIIIKKTRVFGTSKITAIELRKMEGKVSLRRKVEGFFFEVGRYIIPDCEVEDQIHFIASNYQSEEN